MPSIFLGFSGAGGGGSSFRFGIAYGPTSLPGPPASGGASCLLGFCGEGGCDDWSCASAPGVPAKSTPKISNDSNLRKERVPMVSTAQMHAITKVNIHL